MRLLVFSAFLLGAATWAGAQTVPLTQNALTNHDIVTLAKAGFNEDFIIDFMGASRTQFDTSVNGIAELAKEGLTERLIRAMMNPGAAGIAAKSATPIAAAAPVMVLPPDERHRSRAPKQSESSVAISNLSPYYRSSSVFWGLFKKKTSVGAGMRLDPTVNTQLNAAFGQMQYSNPAGMPVRYVVIP
jgi:hypothetical protein